MTTHIATYMPGSETMACTLCIPLLKPLSWKFNARQGIRRHNNSSL